MAKKQAYETYYRDKFGELKTRLVDAVTGKPVTNPKEYEVIDSTDSDIAELTGAGSFEDAGSPDQVKKDTKSFVKPLDQRFGGGRGGFKGKGKTKNGEARGPKNNFGFINKPGWTKFAGPAASILGGPIAGAAVTAAKVGINLNNIEAKNAAREALGLEPKDESFFEKAKNVAMGPNDTLGETKIGDNTYDVSFGGGVSKKGKSSLTFNETVARREALDRQKNPAKYDANLKSLTNPRARLHPELDPSTATSKTRTTTNNITYVNQKAQRNEKLNPDVEAKLSKAVAGYFGPNYHAEITSGKGFKTNAQGLITAEGNHNHPLGTAGDFDVVDNETGQKVGASEMQGFGAYAAANHDFTGIGGPGYMGAGRMHLDTNHPGLAVWGGADKNKIGAAVERGFGFPGPGAPIPAERPTQEQPSIAMDSNLPAGMRNNNPGNLKYDAAVEWDGLVGPSENTDQGDFQAVFATPELGMRAAAKLAKNKYDKGLKTVRDIITDETGWTPGYLAAAQNIAKAMGIDLDDDLQLDQPERQRTFMRALITQEQGTAANAYSDDMIDGAIKAFTDPASMIDPTKSDFENYSQSFYSAMQSQPDPNDNAGVVGNMGREDSESSNSFGSNRPASGMSSPSSGTRAETSNMGRGDTPSSGRSSPSAASYGSSYTGKSGSTSSPSEGIGRGAGTGISKGPSGPSMGGSSANTARADTPSSGKSSFGGIGKSESEKSEGPSGGGYGGWGGPR